VPPVTPGFTHRPQSSNLPPRKPTLPFHPVPFPTVKMKRGKWLIPLNSLQLQLSRHQNERSAIAVLSNGHKLVLSSAPCDISSRVRPKKQQKQPKLWPNLSILARANVCEVRSDFGQNWVSAPHNCGQSESGPVAGGAIGPW